MANVTIKDLHDKLDVCCEDIAFIKGKLQATEKTTSDWWSRLGIIGVFIFAMWDKIK